MGWKATGTWRGHYSFDPNPDCPDLPDQTGFVLRLRQSWLFGSLTGDVSDEPPHGVPGLGTIEGRVCGDVVEFVKRMPEYCVWWEGRLTPLAEYLAVFGHHLDVPPLPLPLKYTGRYQPATDELVGRWEFAISKTTVLCDGNLLDLLVPAGGGRWTATRSAGK